jgi:glycosyltransferase involved in cell wall biosynthesis
MALVTVVVCVRDGEKDLPICLGALAREIKAVQGQISLLVVDHLSNDSTPTLARDGCARIGLAARFAQFREPGIAAVRDFGWRNTETPWVAFVDVDCEVMPGWGRDVLQRIEEFSPRLKLAAFGGASLVAKRSEPIYQAFPIALESWIGGHGSLLNRPVQRSVRMDHCPTLNVVYRRSALEVAGGFDRRFMRVAEDLDLSARLTNAGYELWGVPGMAVRHGLRSSFRSWAKNMFLYGKGRLYFERIHPQQMEVKFLAPQAVLLSYFGAIFTVFFGFFEGPFLLAVLHFLSIGALLYRPDIRRSDWGKAAYLVWITHLSYGAGMWHERIFRGLSRASRLQETSSQKSQRSDTRSGKTLDAA